MRGIRLTLAFVALAAASASTETTAPLSVLLNRAQIFKAAGLHPLAREQYAFILKIDPNNKDAARAISDLETQESEDRKASAVAKKQLIQDRKSQSELLDRISKNYRDGIERFQNGQLDLALSHFVRVLNLDPEHKGALEYIEKIGKRR